MLVQDLLPSSGTEPRLQLSGVQKVSDLDHLRAFPVHPGWYDLDLVIGHYPLAGQDLDQQEILESGMVLGTLLLGGA